MSKFVSRVGILKVSNDILDNEILLKQKNLNRSNIISKAKLIDYAVVKTYYPELLEVLRKDKYYKEFLRFYDDKNV